MNARSRRNGSAGNPVKFGEPRPKPPLICGALRGVLAAAFTWKSGHPWRPLSLPFFFSFSPTTCQLSGTASRRAPANLLDPHLMPLPTTSQEENEDDRVHPPLLITIRDQSSWTDRWIVEKFRSCFRFQSARNSKIFISLFTSHRSWKILEFILEF